MINNIIKKSVNIMIKRKLGWKWNKGENEWMINFLWKKW